MRNRVAKSPKATLEIRGSSKLIAPTTCYCYRVERTSPGVGLPPLWTSVFSRFTRIPQSHRRAGPQNREV